MKRHSTGAARILVGAATAGALLIAPVGVAAAAPDTGRTTEPPTTSTTDDPTSTTDPSPTEPPTTTEPPTSEPTTSEPTTPQPTTSVPDTGEATISVSPSSAHPGDHVTVRLSCLGDRGDITSSALSIGGTEGAAGSTYTDATVRSGTDPGTYPISSSCEGRPLSTTMTVLEAASEPDTDTDTQSPEPSQVVVVPKGPAETGDGSAAAGDGTAPATVGVLALLAGGGIGGYSLLRRRRSGSGS